MEKLIAEIYLNTITTGSIHNVKWRYESFVFIQSQSYCKWNAMQWYTYSYLTLL